MIQIPIVNIPNQSLSINLDGNQYDIRITGCSDQSKGSGIVAFDIVRNGTIVITGARAVAGYPIIASKYLEDGNFLVETMNDEYPDWRQFGITQILIFASQSELETIRASA